MTIQNTEFGNDEALVVRPKRACQMLSIGQTRLYELLNRGELEAYRDGAARKITTRSIRGYIERQLERVRAA
jgi:excisionase family DNA binding protein